MLYKKYYCIKQHNIKDCGCACLDTICKQYRLNYPISKIREVAGTDKQGNSDLGVIKAAKQLGFVAKGGKASKPEDIFSELPLPAVDGALLHYVVVHKITGQGTLNDLFWEGETYEIF